MLLILTAFYEYKGEDSSTIINFKMWILLFSNVVFWRWIRYYPFQNANEYIIVKCNTTINNIVIQYAQYCEKIA